MLAKNHRRKLVGNDEKIKQLLLLELSLNVKINSSTKKVHMFIVGNACIAL